MPTLEFHLSQAELEVLSYERYHYPDPVVLPRLHAIYLKAKFNLSLCKIGELTGAHPNSVSAWIKGYQKGGMNAICVNNYGTNKSQLDSKAADIISCLKQSPPHTTAMAAQTIFELTGIERGLTQTRAFLKRYGFAFRKTGHIPAKADVQVQEQWLEQTLQPAIESAEKGLIHLLFMDASHFVLQPFLCFLWSIVRVFIKASSGRNRINVLGAVNAISKEVTTLINASYVNAETIMEFFQQLRQRYCDGRIIQIVLDNARYQHCDAVKTAAQALDIELLFLPPYSPNLNIIERLWRFVKKKVLYAKYYDKPAAFHRAIRDFFESINEQCHEELQNLLTLKFQIIKTPNSQIYPP